MKNINLPPQPKLYMPYGYYTPLAALEEEPETTAPIAKIKDKTPKKPEAPVTSKVQKMAQNSSFFSFQTAKTALKYTTLAVGALAMGLFIYNLSQNPGGLPHNPLNPEGNGSGTPSFPNQTYPNQSIADPFIDLSTGVVSNFNSLGETLQFPSVNLQGVGVALAKTGADLAQAIRDPNTALGTARDVARRTYEKGLQVVNEAKAQAIASYYGFNEELEEVPITEHDQQVLDIRAKHPTYFSTSFISKALADGRSAIGKVIALAAAKGEAPTPFAQYAAFSSTSSTKYTLDAIDTPEKIQAILGKMMTKDEFVAQRERFSEYQEGEYEAYIAKYNERAARFSKIKGQVKPETFSELEEAHFREAQASSDFVKRKFMHLTPDAPKTTFDVASYRGAAPKQGMWRTEYAREGVAYDSRKANFQVDEMNDGDILLSRSVWNTESKGEASSSWDKFMLGCLPRPR